MPEKPIRHRQMLSSSLLARDPEPHFSCPACGAVATISTWALFYGDEVTPNALRVIRSCSEFPGHPEPLQNETPDVAF